MNEYEFTAPQLETSERLKAKICYREHEQTQEFDGDKDAGSMGSEFCC